MARAGTFQQSQESPELKALARREPKLPLVTTVQEKMCRYAVPNPCKWSHLAKEQQPGLRPSPGRLPEVMRGRAGPIGEP